MTAVSKAERLLNIEQILLANPKGLTQAEIARRLDVSPSTISRYLPDLTAIFPIYQDEAGRIGIIPDAYLASALPRGRAISSTLEDLIERGESSWLEFKVSACWNIHQNLKDHKLVDNIIRAVAGFMNSARGGVILIGVDDDKRVIGLENDYKYADPNKQDRDGYELFLRNALNNSLGAQCITFYNIDFLQASDGKEVCRISCRDSSRPVYFKGSFYVRNGNQTRLLTTQEAIEYIKDRWL